MRLHERVPSSQVLLAFGFMLVFSALCVVSVVFSNIAWVRPVVLVGIAVTIVGFMRGWVFIGLRDLAKQTDDDEPTE